MFGSSGSVENEYVEISVKESVENLDILDIQKMVMWAKCRGKKVSFMGIYNRENLNGLDFFFLKNEVLDIKEIRKFGFKSIARLSNCKNLDNLPNILFKESKLIIFEQLYAEKTRFNKIERRSQKNKSAKRKLFRNNEKTSNENTVNIINTQPVDEYIENEDARLKVYDNIFSDEKLLEKNRELYKTILRSESNQISLMNNSEVDNTRSQATQFLLNAPPNIKSTENIQKPKKPLLPENYTTASNECPSQKFANFLSSFLRQKANFYKIDLLYLKMDSDFSFITSDNFSDMISDNYNSIYYASDLYADSLVSLSKISKPNFRVLQYKGPLQYHELIAIDCEMVRHGTKPILGRISVCDKFGKCIYDKFVIPDLPITDYVTKYSGITADSFSESNKNKIVDRAKLYDDLSTIIHPNTVIVGQSLFNDLNVLEILHTRFIDTSFLYKGLMNRRQSLKALAQKYLGKLIQNGIHCSFIDAYTCLELVALKCEAAHNLKVGNVFLDLGAQVHSFDNFDSFVPHSDNSSGDIHIITCLAEDLINARYTYNYRSRLNMIFFRTEKGVYCAL